jgi:hypothetical protein
VAYIVNTVDDVESYLRNLSGISESARARVIEAYLRDLADHADEFLERNPVAHESYTFHYEYIIIDGGSCYSFRFIADGSAMPYGVVTVVYADCEIRPAPT